MINTVTLRHYNLREHHRQNAGNMTSTPSACLFLFRSSTMPSLGFHCAPPRINLLSTLHQRRSLAPHQPCQRRYAVPSSTHYARAKAWVPHAQCSAQHALAGVSDARCAVFGLRSEHRRVVDSGI